MRSCATALVFALTCVGPPPTVRVALAQTTPDSEDLGRTSNEARQNDETPPVDNDRVPTVDEIDEQDGFDDDVEELTAEDFESGRVLDSVTEADDSDNALIDSSEGVPAPAATNGQPANPPSIRFPAVKKPTPAAPADARPAARPAGGVAVPAPARRRRPLKLRAPTKPVQVVTEDQLKAQVERMVEAYRLGDQQRFLVEQAELESMRSRAGVANIVLASSVLIRHAQSALSVKAYDRAVDLAAAAVRISPDLVAAHWTQLRVLWAQDWVQLRKIAGAFGSLLGAQFGSFRNQVSILTSVLVILGLAGFLTIIAFAAVQLIKYVRYPAHDIARRLPPIIGTFVGTGELVILLALLVLLPVAFGYGPAMSALIAFVIVAGYQQSRERGFSRFLIGLLALMPVGLLVLAPLVTFHGSIVDDMAAAASEAFAGPAEQRLLKASAGKRNRDPTSALILARRMRLRGDLRGADLAYQHALLGRPDDTVALTNRGVVQYLLGRPQAAVALFERAAKSDRVEAVLNLSTIRAEEGKFDTATQLLERARYIDASLAAQYSQRQEGGGETSKQLFEAEIETGVLWNRLLDVDHKTWWLVADSLWSRIGGHTPLWFISAWAILALIMSYVLVRREHKLSTACPKCGTPANRKAYGFLCEQCTSVFLTAVAVEPRLRARKESEVRSYQKRRRLTERITAVIAGVGEFMAGRPQSGALLFFLLAVAILAWAFQGGIMVHDWQVAADSTAGAAVGGLALCFAAVLCLISLRQSFDR